MLTWLLLLSSGLLVFFCLVGDIGIWGLGVGNLRGLSTSIRVIFAEDG